VQPSRRCRIRARLKKIAATYAADMVEVIEAFAKKTIANLAGVEERTVNQWLKSGQLGPPDSEIDGTQLWYREKVEAALATRKAKQRAKGAATRATASSVAMSGASARPRLRP
jgi:DNA-binding transcriptional regulator YdaS (Cro superfamily)